MLDRGSNRGDMADITMEVRKSTRGQWESLTEVIKESLTEVIKESLTHAIEESLTDAIDESLTVTTMGA